jgi:hypothetical protein
MGEHIAVQSWSDGVEVDGNKTRVIHFRFHRNITGAVLKRGKTKQTKTYTGIQLIYDRSRSQLSKTATIRN